MQKGIVHTRCRFENEREMMLQRVSAVGTREATNMERLMRLPSLWADLCQERREDGTPGQEQKRGSRSIGVQRESSNSASRCESCVYGKSVLSLSV